MIKSTIECFCDCCGKNMTSERYRWRTSFGETSDDIHEIESVDYIFCKDCAIEFHKWCGGRREKQTGYAHIINVGYDEYALAKGVDYSDLTKEEREIMREHRYRG